MSHTQPEFFRLPSGSVSTALKLLSSTEEGKTAAKTILQQPEFFRLQFEIVSTALKLLCNTEGGKTAAKTILQQPELFKLPHQIVSSALNLLNGTEEGETAAKTILQQPEFFKLSYQIVSSALNLLNGTEEGETAAKTILQQPEFFKLSYQIVSSALNLLNGTEEGKTAAKTILQQPEFFKLPPQIVSTAIKLLSSTEEGKAAARTILQRGLRQNTFLLSNALKQVALSNHSEDKQLVINFLNDITSALKTGASKGTQKLYFEILYLPLMEFDAHRSRVLGIIKNYKTCLPRNRKSNIYRVLKCYNDYPQISYFRTEIEALCTQILNSWQADIQYQLKNHPDNLLTAHIEQALMHQKMKELAKKKAREIINFADKEENKRFKSSGFYIIAGNILDLNVLQHAHGGPDK